MVSACQLRLAMTLRAHDILGIGDGVTILMCRWNERLTFCRSERTTPLLLIDVLCDTFLVTFSFGFSPGHLPLLDHDATEKSSKGHNPSGPCCRS